MRNRLIYMILLALAIVGLTVPAWAQDKKISQLTPLPSVLGTELIPVARSGANYYMTPSQLPAYLGGNFIPLIGTSSPLVGTIEYRGSSASTCMVDTVGTMYIGSGNRKSLSIATTFGRIAFLVSGGAQVSSTGASGTGNGTFNPNSTSISAANSSSVTTGINLTGTTGLVSGTYSLFAGLTYSTDYSANYTSRSLIDKAYASATFAPISGGAYVPLAGTGTVTPLTGSIIYNGGGSTTALGSTTSEYYIGAGNVSTLQTATNFARTYYDGSGYLINSVNDGTGDACSIEQDAYNITLLSTNSTGKTNSLFIGGAGMAFNTTYTNSIGVSYGVSTATTVAANGTGKTLFHRDYNDTRYLLASSYSTSVTSATAPLSITTNTVSLLYGTGLSVSSNSLIAYNIPNSALTNSTFTVNGTGMALGTSSTVTAAAGTLTGTALNSTVVTSSLTTVGTVTAGVISTTITAIASQSLTISAGGTTTVNGYNNNGQTLYTTSTATATTMAYSNIPNGSSVMIDYQKTTSSDLQITFPSGSVVGIESNAVISGGQLVAILSSSASGRFAITIRNINSVYKVSIIQNTL